MLKSKADELLERLQEEGKVTYLSDEEVKNMDEHIGKGMKEFEQELRRKQAQSETDTAKIFINV